MRKIKTSIFVIIIAAAALFFFSKNQAGSFDNVKTHRDLAQLSVELYNSKHPDSRITDEESNWIKEGVKDEDIPFTRCANHFYDPINKKSLAPGTLTAIDWAHNSNSQSMPSMGGVYTWEQAKYSFIDKGKKKAFQSLGHVMHLIEDMTVPAHVRDDTHIFKSDAFEEWARDFGVGIKPNQIKTCSNLDSCMDELAEYTNKNFLSTDSVYKFNTLEDIKSIKKVLDEDVFGDLNIYGVKKDPITGKEYKFIALNRDFTIKSKSLDKLVFSDYFSLLSPQAVSYGARAIELFKQEAQQEAVLRKPKTVWSWIENAFKQAASLANAGKEKTEGAVEAAYKGMKNIVSESVSDIKNFAQGPALTYLENEEKQETKKRRNKETEEEKISSTLGMMYNGKIVDQSGNTEAIGGSKAILWVKIKNTGLLDWEKNQISLNITTPAINGRREDSLFYDSSWITRLRPASNNQDASKGDIASFEFQISVPEKSGMPVFNLRPVYQDSNNDFHWLGDNTSISWNVFVKERAYAKLPAEEEKSKSKNKEAEEIGNQKSEIEKEESRKEAEKAPAFAEAPADKPEKEIKKLAENTLPEPIALFSAPSLPSLFEKEGDVKEPEPNPETEPELESEPDPEQDPEQEQEQDPEPEPFAPNSVIISEIAWAGTLASSDDEWIELYNNTEEDIDLSGWILQDKAADLSLDFANAKNKTIKSHSYYLIERGDDNAVKNISADFVSSFPNGLNNNGEDLILKDSLRNIIDETNAEEHWFAGNKDRRITMERINPNSPGSDSSNWVSNNTQNTGGRDADNRIIYGTPKKKNSSANDSDWPQIPDKNAPVEIMRLAEIGTYPNSILQTKIEGNKIYYAWVKTKVNYNYNINTIYLASSNLDGTNYQEKEILSGTRMISDLEFLIRNDKAYFAWLELISETLLTGKYSYKTYAASANLSAIDSPEDESYKEVLLTPLDKKTRNIETVALNFYNSELKVSWSENDDTIYISNLDPETLELEAEQEQITAFIQGGLNSAIQGNTQYFTWNRDNVRPETWSSPHCGELNLETGSFQYSAIENKRTENIKLAFLNESPIIFWTTHENNMIIPSDNRNIEYANLANLIPQTLLNSVNNKIITDVKTNSGNAYLLYQESDLEQDRYYNSVSYQSLNLLKLDQDLTIKESFSYYIPGQVSTTHSIVSSRLNFLADGTPLISWVMRNANDNYSFHLTRVEKWEE